jgi:hypothetical protein
MKHATVTATRIRAVDLLPGDLFSIATEDYWRKAMDKSSIGEQVYIRTNTPAKQADDSYSFVYRITINKHE